MTTLSDDKRAAMLAYLGISGVGMSNADLEAAFWSTFSGHVEMDRGFIIPPISAALQGTAESAWFTANFAVAPRFMLPYSFVPDRAQIPCTVASGNIEVSIHSIVRTGVNTFDHVKVASSGVIACPAVGSGGAPGNSITVPFVSPPELLPGEYVVVFWADNTTINVAHALSNTMLRAGLSLGFGGASVGGVPTSGSMAYSGRAIAISVEGVIPLG